MFSVIKSETRAQFNNRPDGKKIYFGIYTSSPFTVAAYLYRHSQLAIAVCSNGEKNYFGIYLYRSSRFAIAVWCNDEKTYFGINLYRSSLLAAAAFTNGEKNYFQHTNETYLKLTFVESFVSFGSRLERG